MRMFRQREAELSQKSRAYEEAKASGDKWAAARAMGELQVAYQRFQAASDIAIKNLEDRIALNDKLRQEQEQAEQNRQLSRIAQAAQQQSFTDRFVDDIHQAKSSARSTGWRRSSASKHGRNMDGFALTS
jgi:hypothetical protein